MEDVKHLEDNIYSFLYLCVVDIIAHESPPSSAPGLSFPTSDISVFVSSPDGRISKKNGRWHNVFSLIFNI